MTKAELRKIYLQKRLSLSEAEFAELNTKLCNQFFSSVDLENVNVLHIFLPLEKKREPNTWLIIDEIKKRYLSIKVSIPKINEEGILESYYLKDIDQLETGSWGIPEPVRGEKTSPQNIDMIIVPLLAYDKKGNRIGYGKGHYDRYLKQCRADCKKIGISFFEAEGKIEFDQFDMKLDATLTPGGLQLF